MSEPESATVQGARDAVPERRAVISEIAEGFLVASEAEWSRESSLEFPSVGNSVVAARPRPESQEVGMKAVEAGQESVSETAARGEGSAAEGWYDLGIWTLRAES